jgi:hypothetical protein
MPYLVLNRSDAARTSLSSEDISKELKHRIDALKLHFYDLERGGVNYESLSGSKAYSDYKRATEGLVSFHI